MQAIHYFPGGNTAEGFCSHFGDILPAPMQRRMFYLKGGPGVGKSTLMRRVGEAAEKAGLEVEYFHCSSDPDSLDAVCLPQKGAALMDGTAPHVYDPVAPGARDTLVSLGDFLDEAALRSHIEDILNLQKAISGRSDAVTAIWAARKRCWKQPVPDRRTRARRASWPRNGRRRFRSGAAGAVSVTCSAQPIHPGDMWIWWLAWI